MKNISLHGDVSRVFSGLAGMRMRPGTRREIAEWAVSLRAFRSPPARVPGISKSLLLVLLKFKVTAHNFATSLSRNLERSLLHDEKNNEKVLCIIAHSATGKF